MAPAVQVRLTPLWWRDDAVPAVQVQALHDGQSLAFRLEWEDPIADTHAGKVEAFKDAIALEFVRGRGGAVFWAWEHRPRRSTCGCGTLIADSRAAISKRSIRVWLWTCIRSREKVVETAEFARPGTKTSQQPDLVFPAKAVGNQIARARRRIRLAAVRSRQPVRVRRRSVLRRVNWSAPRGAGARDAGRC